MHRRDKMTTPMIPRDEGYDLQTAKALSDKEV